jgi:hypothetical protein
VNVSNFRNTFLPPIHGNSQLLSFHQHFHKQASGLFTLGMLEFELRAWHLLGKCCITWATLPDFFAVVCFLDNISCFCLGWP